MNSFYNIMKSFVKIIKTTGGIFCCIICIFTTNAKPGNTTSEQIEKYLNSIEILDAEFSQTNSNNNDIDKGSISIRRETINTKTSVIINYKTGAIESMSLSGRFMTIVDRKNKKSSTYSIRATPIYAIFAGKLNLKELMHQVIEDTGNHTIIRIIYDKQIIELTFRKTNNMVDKLLSWTIYNDNGWTDVKFDDMKYYVKVSSEHESVSEKLER